jgi:hypothetical protein
MCLICKCNPRFQKLKNLNQPLKYGDLAGPLKLNESQYEKVMEAFAERKDKFIEVPIEGVYVHEL